MLISRTFNLARKDLKKRMIVWYSPEYYRDEVIKSRERRHQKKKEIRSKMLQFMPEKSKDPDYDPIKNISECLPFIPKEMFDKPNDFIDAIITGGEFNKYFAPRGDYYKIVKINGKHYGMEYQDGLNIDPNQFKMDENCGSGLHFTWIPQWWIRIYNGHLENGFRCSLRKVTLPEDAIVQIHEDKMRADRIILGPSLTDDYRKDYDHRHIDITGSFNDII